MLSLFFFQEALTLDLWMALLSFPGYENSLIKLLLRHMVTSSLGFSSFNTVSAILTLSLRPGTVLGDKFDPVFLIVSENSALETKYNSIQISRLSVDKEWPIYSNLAHSTLT